MNLFLKKPIAQIQAETAHTELKRSLGALNLVSLGIGCIIGAGIFVMTGTAAAQHAGPALMLSFVFSGVACLLAALCYAELASVLPVSGSAYAYAYATLGEIVAWIIGCLLVLEYGLASATVAVGWSGYVVSFLRDLHIVIPPELTQPLGADIKDATGAVISHGIVNLPAAFGIAMMTLLLIVGVKESATVNNVIVITKVCVVVAFIAIGFFYVDPANWHPFIPAYVPEIKDAAGNITQHEFGGMHGVLRAASIIFFAYIGFEAVSTAGQETINPQRDMPIGIIGSLVVCTVLYMLTSAVLTGIVPYQELNVPDPMAVAVDHIGLGWFSVVIKIGALMGLTSVMLVLLYGQTRIFYTIAADGLLPGLFSKVHPKFQTPWVNTIIVGIVVSIAAALTPISTLGDLVSMGTLAAFVVVCFSVWWLRYKEPQLPRPFRVKGLPFVAAGGILACGYLISTMPAHLAKFLMVWLGVGLLIYFLYGRRHSKLRLGDTILDNPPKDENIQGGPPA
jgi:APA family basic amino acid/polyamine antiporter